MGKPARTAEQRLLEALNDYRWGGPFKVGDYRPFVLHGDGLELEITVRVRRHAQTDDLAAYRAAALAQLRERPGLATRCQCQLRKKARYGNYYPSCSARPVAAVVYDRGYTPPGTPPTQILFVCRTHRDSAIDPAAVRAVVELPLRALEEARAEAAKREAEAIARQRAEDEAREQARRAEEDAARKSAEDKARAEAATAGKLVFLPGKGPSRG